MEIQIYMNGINIRKIEIIVKDLLSEFDKESTKLQVQYDDNVARIIEIEENIHNYKENEDVDFQVFSPRKIDNQNEERIDAMNSEKENIENINKSLYRQIKYYTEKKEKLNEILSIIEEDREFAENEDDSITETSSVSKESDIDDITKVDEKILAYYDSIASQDDDNYPEEPENIGTEVRSGWRLIKDELKEPVEVFNRPEPTESRSADNSEILSSLQDMTVRLESETKKLEEDYIKTKNEINSVLSEINSILGKIK